MSHFEKRVQLNKIIESQLPEFLVADFPKAIDFFRQYYISQEYQGGNVDLVDNLDNYLKVDNLVPEVIVGQTTLSSDITTSSSTITVASTKGFPEEYGLLKIDDEIITYTSRTETTFNGCVRGFSGVTGYNVGITSFINDVNRQNVIFSTSSAASHTADSVVTNLSVLFLQEFYRKLKASFTPGLEDVDFVSDLNVGNFIKHARNFYQSKGIAESVRILFKVLFGVKAEVLDLEERLIKPSSADYVRREVAVVEGISGNPFNLKGQTITKSNDSGTSASVSDVEIFTRGSKTYYKLGLFVGYNDRDVVEGIFTVPGYTKALESSSVGASVITVDSTIGFPESGTIISGNNTIQYTSKSINQFLGCTGIQNAISTADPVRADETAFGYENGDVSKRVDVRLTGVLSEFVPIGDISLIEKGEEITVKNVGEIIENPTVKTYKQVFANSWIYNTSTRYRVSTVSGSTFTLFSEIDKSSLRVGDTVDVLLRNSEIVVSTNATVNSINQSLNQVSLGNLSASVVSNPGTYYDIRRKLKKVSSSSTSLKYGNSAYLASVLNVYNDDNSTYGYVASNSLPEYEINDQIISDSIPNGSTNNFEDYDAVKQAYSTIKFPSNVKFIDGDRVFYNSDNPLPGLNSGELYYVKLVASNKIRLYASRSLLSGSEFVRFGANGSTETHTFTLERHKNKILDSNRILRKFPTTKNPLSSIGKERGVNTIGILIDGVEISSPDSRNSIYYGPLSEFQVFNGGNNYDVVRPPQITISTGAGTTALVEPIIVGSVKDVLVDPQDFDIKEVLNITLTGGNGSGCILKPILGDRFREIEFDSRDIAFNGGIDVSNDTISFTQPHNLVDGEHIIYNQNGNNPIPIGTFNDPAETITDYLASGDEYVSKVINPSTIILYKNDSDALAGINTIGISTTTTAAGIHKFRTLSKTTLRKIKVLDPGSGYQYRKLRVPSSGISTEYNTLTYENHGFNNGDIVNYSFDGTVVSGLSTSNQYSIYKLDNNKFRLINVGVGATLTTDLTRSKYVEFGDVGSGYQIFQYPEITVSANVSYGSSIKGNFTFTPIVTGSIEGAYLYEKGNGYGSNILNLEKKPTISIQNGKNAQLNPVISGGRIIDVQVLSKGSEYFSTPDLIVSDGKLGSGAVLRPVMVDNKIDSVIIINGGIGYDPSTINIEIKPRGFGAIFDTRVRQLRVNDAQRFGEYSKLRNPKIFSSLSQNETEDGIVYGMYGYSEDLGKIYGDDGSSHSPIIGWAYDGNPIYGPYGYKDPENIQSGVELITSGYELDSSSVKDRPSTSLFASGFFIDDYSYKNSGHLDSHNGRFCKTPEFPNGVYAYFATVTNGVTSNKLEPFYPYFIGNKFKSSFIQENATLDQSFDFNNSNLVRNTFPYNANNPYADYDFYTESYEDFEQISEIESTLKGEIDDIRVDDGGSGYRIGERVNFDFEGTGGNGLRAEVSELVGKDITSIQSSLERYPNSVLVWDTDTQISAYYRNGYDLVNNETVLVSGLTTSVFGLYGSKKVGLTTETVGLSKSMTSYSSIVGGKYEDIFLSTNPSNVSIGGTIVIGSEEMKILNDYKNGVLRVRRFVDTGVGHTLGSEVYIKNDRIKLSANTPKFDSKRNHLVYFNAKDSVGLGTTSGGAITKSYTVGEVTDTISIPYNSIYIPNHPFKTGQRLTFTKSDVAGVDSLIVGDDDTGLQTFFIPDTFTLTSDVYVIDKGRNYIGLTTSVGLTTNTSGLFFYSDGTDNSEYLLKTNFTQITADIDRVTTLVSTGSSHGLEQGDQIKLTVKPNTIVGLGTTAAVRVSLEPNDKTLLLNATGINSTGIDTATNVITFNDHGYKTGDKVYYTSVEVASGLSTGMYYVIQDSSNTFRLAETKHETNPDSEKSINIVGTGDTTHTFGLVNPKINVVKNSDLKFLLDDESLRGYELKIYKNKDFTNEYITTFDDSNFNVVGVGSVGYPNASLTLSYSKNVPSKLYYALEKSGYISTSDIDVNNYSEINYIDSEYNGTYNVFGISTNSFKISPSTVPTVLSYQKSETDVLEYTTKSSTAINGSIGKVKILSKGFNFNQLPKFSSVTTQDGQDANVSAISTSIGNIKNVRIRDIGYDYASDKTLRPEVFVPPVVGLDNFDTIDQFNIEFAGRNYLTPPNLLLINDETKEVVDNSSLVAEAPNGSISNIIQLAPIYGLKSQTHKVICTSNSNGVGISTISSVSSGIATCTLKTPIVGFITPPFKTGDKIYVEGIELTGSGTGYNSEDYGYRFFTVKSYVNTNPAKLVFEIKDESGVGLSTNAGIAKTVQSGYANIINESDYPVIDVIKKRSVFYENEQLYVNRDNSGYIQQNLYVSSVRNDYIKVKGRFSLRVGDQVKGKVSGAIADITSVSENRSKFMIDYSSPQEIGWRKDTGVLSEDYSVVQDNDYFQNLSYSIKSPITWDEFSNPVNGILHPAGMKNFADVGITSTASGGIDFSGSTSAVAVLDIVEEKRVDTINYFDTVIDIDTKSNPDQSKFLKFKNRKLANFTECRTNRVLIHDDVSDQFSNKDNQDLFVEVDVVDTLDTNVKYLIQIVDVDSGKSQISELVLQSTNIDTYLFEKYTLSNVGIGTTTNNTTERLGTFSADVDSFSRKSLIFTPTDPYNRDHDIKIIKKTFLSDLSGIGTQSIGQISLIGSNINGIGTVGSATSIGNIVSISDVNFNGLFANVEITNPIKGTVEYVEASLLFDGNDVYLSEYYFDSLTLSYSASTVGILTASYNSGVITLDVANNEIENTINVRSNVVGFGSTAAGIGTYRFLVSNQVEGTELTARNESTYGSGTSPIRIGSFDVNRDTSVSSIVKVSAGNTSAIHQVAALFDPDEGLVTISDGPFSAINTNIGIGTFVGEYSLGSSEFYVNFVPDSGYDVELQSFNEVLNTANDYDNEPDELTYGPVNQELLLDAYDGINGTRGNKDNFVIKHQGKNIYSKVFTPNNSSQLDPVTGIFTIQDHFLNTGEELIYSPKSSFVGAASSAVGIGSTENYLGIVTDRLPSRVYPIALTPDTFRLSTKRSYANAGIYVTFTDFGLGNAHELEMTNKLSKTVISLNGIVQQPLAFTPISHTLDYNSGSITSGISTFNLSGISSIQPRDVLKIDDEYMKVVEVGLSTNVGGALLGPINGIIQAGTAATFPTVSVTRASFGSTAVSHSDGANVQIYRGSINIVGNKVFFAEAPRGNTRARRNQSNIPYSKSQYSGRTFLRSNYDSNILFDDISDQFTGIGRTYTMTSAGLNTSGVDVGNGLVLINGVFQTPSTLNNVGNNYEFVNDNTAGISTIVFTGISSADGTKILSDFDVNQNQLPRGGLIVSLGSTQGLGYAPLVGAKVEAELTNGSITNIVGVNTYKRPVSISTAAYNKNTGVLELETVENHYLIGGERVKLVGLHFTCSSEHAGVTTTIFPDHDRSFDIENIFSNKKLSVQVGVSTIGHDYVGFGSVYQYYNLNLGSGYRNPVSIGVTDLSFEHKFVRSEEDSITDNLSNTYTPTAATFTPHTGQLVLTIPGHGLTVSNTVGIDTGSLIFTCSEDNFFTEQAYPRSTDPVSGIQTSITSVSTNTITVNVGAAGGAGTGAIISAQVGAGGTLALSIDNGGTGYVNPRIIIPEPTYENIPVEGVSRLSVGPTTETGENLLMNLKIGAASTNVGIGSTLFLVESFEITRPGYSFQVGDVFKPVGLVTAAHLAQPISEFQLEVVEIFNDRFASWSFGEMDYIDSTRLLQDGSRTRFPLYYNGELLSFEIDPDDPLSGAIDLDALLLIFVNGVLQEPKKSYQFTGGTSFIFSEAPSESDKVDVFFYKGQDGVDISIINVTETVKIGDLLSVSRNPLYPNTISQQRSRTLVDILGSDTIETDNYTGIGIDENTFKPLDWTKQKIDKYVKGELVSKTRDVYEPNVYPTAKIIGSIDGSTTDIFVDDAQFFNYEENEYGIAINTVDGLIVQGSDPVSAAFTATVGTSGTITAITVTNVGSGYSATGTIPIKFSAPVTIGTGIGTIAEGEATLTNGSVSSVSITNIGLGYTNTNPPQLIAPIPNAENELITGISNVQGFAGIITGISTTTGTGGHPLALKINFTAYASDANDLQVGYPILVHNTKVGIGITSVDDSDSSIVGIGTEYLDNVYIVHSKTNTGPLCEIICNIHTNSSVVGIATTGFYNPLNVGLTTSLGSISWGRIYNFDSRRNPVSFAATGLTVNSGLTTFPSIQRRSFGLKNNGSIRSFSNTP